jgi:hypothetical protein
MKIARNQKERERVSLFLLLNSLWNVILQVHLQLQLQQQQKQLETKKKKKKRVAFLFYSKSPVEGCARR